MQNRFNGLPHPKGDLAESLRYFASVESELQRLGLYKASLSAGYIRATLESLLRHPHTLVPPFSEYRVHFLEGYNELMESNYFDHGLFSILKHNLKGLSQRAQHPARETLTPSDTDVEQAPTGDQASAFNTYENPQAQSPQTVAPASESGHKSHEAELVTLQSHLSNLAPLSTALAENGWQWPNNRFSEQEVNNFYGVILLSLNTCHQLALSGHIDKSTEEHLEILFNAVLSHKRQVTAMQDENLDPESSEIEVSGVLVEHADVENSQDYEPRTQAAQPLTTDQEAAAEVYKASKIAATAAVNAAASLGSTIFGYFRGSQQEDPHGQKTFSGTFNRDKG